MCYVKNVIDKVNKRNIMLLNFAEKVNEKLFEIYGCSDIRIFNIPETNTMKILFMVMDDDEYKSVEVEYDAFIMLNAENIQELYDMIRQAIKEKLDIDLDL